MKYGPCVIGELYLDNLNYTGLYFWYETIIEINKPPQKK